MAKGATISPVWGLKFKNSNFGPRTTVRLTIPLRLSLKFRTQPRTSSFVLRFPPVSHVWLGYMRSRSLVCGFGSVALITGNQVVLAGYPRIKLPLGPQV
jgi:hypothetical protein